MNYVKLDVVFVAVFLMFLSFSSSKADYFNGDKLVDRYQVAIVFSRIAFFTGQVPEGLSTRELPFGDVPPVYARAVATVTSLGVMSGLEDMFNGKTYITRYELGRAVNKLCHSISVAPGAANPHLTPDDVGPFNRHLADAAKASTSRFVELRSGKYNGRNYISRYEFASICARLARHFNLKVHSDVELHLEDVPFSHWARSDVEYACSTGILNTRGVGSKAVHSVEPAHKTEHISKFRRRRNSVHGSFDSEFTHGTFEKQPYEL